MAGGHHEFGAHASNIKTSSERSFGLLFAVFFALLAANNCWHAGERWPYYLGAAVVILAVALVRPAVLAPFNLLWIKLGLLLGKIVTPIVLGLLFFFVVTPVALIARLVGKDFLALHRKPDAPSYWIVRSPPGPAPETMRDQF